MERAVEIFAACQFLILGLSHVAQPAAWVAFFRALAGRGTTGVFLVGLLSLAFGSLVVGFHPVWSGIPMVLTLVGWAHLVKAAVYLVRPQLGLAMLQRVGPERTRSFVVVGAGLIALGGALLVHLATS